MALLQGYNQQEYYEGNIHGDYQFVSLKDVVNQFMVAYVGENKLIPKIRKADVLFHAQRSLQELSFDTITSFKSQEIEVPPSLIMALPHDYVNYTRVLTTDSSGIKHPLYPTKHTQNPFEVRQNNDGSYFFTDENEEVVSHTSDKKLCVIAKPKDGSKNYYGTMHALASKLKIASNLDPIKEIKLKEKKSDGDSKKRKVSAPNKGSSSKS